MPIYEYRCNHCGHRFERLQKISDPDPERCPDCATEGEVTRLISPVGFRLKGGGWYETDFKKDKRHNVAESGNEEKKKPEPESDKSSTKPSEKQDSKPAATEKKESSAKTRKPKPDSKSAAQG